MEKLHETPATALRLSVALSAALATMSPVAAEQHDRAKAFTKEVVPWNAPNASLPSFQSTAVVHGTTPGTLKSIEPDPWQELEALGDDWDTSGAQAVSREAIDHAKRFLKSLSIDAPFAPFAYPDGSVGLESQKNGSAAYILVSPTERFTYVLRIRDAVHRGDDVEASKMRELLALLY